MSASVDIRGDAVVVTLDWPSTRNALGPDEVVELAAAITAAGRTDGVSCVVITGSGAFCSGGDLKKISRIAAELPAEQITEVVYGKFQSMIAALRDCPIPTVSAVDGAAIGLGMDLALACDIRLVGPAGFLAQGWGRAGLIPGTAGIVFLEALAPGLTWTLLASGERLDGAACERYRIARPTAGDALIEALRVATDLVALPAATLRAYVELQRPLRWPTPEFLRQCARLQGGLLASQTFQDFAVNALAPRR